MPVIILLVEDSESDASLMQEWLGEAGSERYEIHHVHNIAEAISAIGGGKPCHVIMLDLSLPDSKGLEGFSIIHNIAQTIPIVIMTGNNDEALALKAVEEGAQDYLVKDSANKDGVRRALRYARQRKNFESDIIRQANFDKLTGLANRALFDSRLRMALGRMARNDQSIGLLFLDLNDFKEINDTLGHKAGDHVLQEIGRRIAQCVRTYDTAARLGGDEFAVLIEGISKPHDCMAVALKLIERIRAPLGVNNKELMVGVSIGIETCDSPNLLSFEDIISHADQAMYSAKMKEDSAFCFYTKDMEETHAVRMKMETDLKSAISNNEFVLCYQPRQSLKDGKTCGAEALVRWHHPERGVILPAEFVDIARDIHMLEEVEQWVISHVCADIRRWQDINLPFTSISVNVSEQLFGKPGFVEFICSLINDAGFNASALSLELCENLFLFPDEAHARTFSRIREIGFGVAMNQFGINTSSLRSLKADMLNEIKFSAADFNMRADGSNKDLFLMKAVINCARSLGLKVTACGVESRELREVLKEGQCDAIQGFIFGRPMPAEYFELWLRSEENVGVENQPAFPIAI